VPTVGWVKETTEAQKILKNSKSSTQVPFLMLTAGNDRIVSTEIAKQQCLNWNNSGLVNCEYYEFPEMRHGLFYEVEQTRNQLFYLINKFIKNSFDASQKIIVDL
jgi:alpha-beta hydrolase superfamily lysophospholipase